MSHIPSGLLKSGLPKGTSSSTQKNNTQMVSKVGPSGVKDKGKEKPKDSRNRPGISGAVNTQKSEYDKMFESNDGTKTIYRKPRPLISNEMNQIAQQRKDLITKQLESNNEKFMKRPAASSPSRSQIDTNQVESSRERSSDSVRASNVSHMDQDTSNRASNLDASDEEKVKRKKHKGHGHREQLKYEDPEEAVFINIGETETNVILHIPSMIVPNDDEVLLKKQETINTQYSNLLIDKSKSAGDNFSEHSTQVLMLPPKHKKLMTDVNSNNRDIKGFGSQVYPQDIETELASEQKTAIEILSLEMKALVEEEIESKLKDPFGLLPTDLRSIEIASTSYVQTHPETKPGRSKHGEKQTGTNRDDKVTRATTNLRGGETTTALGDGLHAGATETSKSKTLNPNTSGAIDKQLEEFKKLLETQEKHLVMNEEEYRLINSSRFAVLTPRRISPKSQICNENPQPNKVSKEVRGIPKLP